VDGEFRRSPEKSGQVFDTAREGSRARQDDLRKAATSRCSAPIADESSDDVLANGGDYLDDENVFIGRSSEGSRNVAAGRTMDAKAVIERLRRAALDASGTEPR
jgi:hypothetical protein